MESGLTAVMLTANLIMQFEGMLGILVLYVAM